MLGAGVGWEGESQSSNDLGNHYFQRATTHVGILKSWGNQLKIYLLLKLLFQSICDNYWQLLTAQFIMNNDLRTVPYLSYEKFQDLGPIQKLLN